VKAVLVLLLAVFTAAARAVTVEWDDDQTNVVYEVYLDRTNLVASTTNKTATITNCVPGVTHTVTVLARDVESGLRSDHSEPVRFTPPKTPARLRLQLSLHRAARPDGPWQEVQQFASFAVPTEEQAFYRAHLTLER
jgi:hypothetical protein